ncbi:MAG: DegT/DnrJ/EryC1/StrS family aminotransferase [Halalkalicoccus sp.]
MITLSRPTLGEEELDRIRDVFERGRLARGPEVESFEDEFAAFCEATHGVATTNGTTALHTALSALGLGEGDRVATSSFSFVPSANAIRWCGAEPTFVDVRENTYTIDPESLETRLQGGERIDAVIAVHLFGLPCDMEYLRELSEEYGFLLIEDAAQAHGAAYSGTPVGAFGDAACFSFFASKNMTTGEGGMVVTDDPDVANRARRFIEHGRTEGGYDGLGHNFCMSDVTAAIGRAQLDKLPAFNESRRENADRFSEGFQDLPVITPIEPPDRRHVYHIYTIQIDDREGLQTHLKERDIRTGVYYHTPIHDQPAYSEYDVSLPAVERLKERVLALPVHPGLSKEESGQVVDATREYFEET